MCSKQLPSAKTMHNTTKRAVPIRTSDEIRTMCNARTTWSMTKGLSSSNKTKDEIRLRRNGSILKRRKLRIENLALRRKVRQMETLIELEGR